jgi:hypothetical protein
MLNDFTAIMYVLTILVSLYGLGLFLWWWHVNGHASEVYIYVTGLFAAMAFANIIALYARLSLLVSPETHFEFVNTFMWEVRMVPVFLTLILIVARMTARAVKGKSQGGNDG